MTCLLIQALTSALGGCFEFSTKRTIKCTKALPHSNLKKHIPMDSACTDHIPLVYTAVS
jgi:hypothetical protein